MIKELEKKNKWKYLKNLYKKNNNKKIRKGNKKYIFFELNKKSKANIDQLLFF